MAKHIHVWLGKTHDTDGPAHAPAGSSKGGQFTSGSGGGGKAPAKKKVVKKAGSSKPLHVQKQEKLDAEKAAKAAPNLHQHLGSGEAKPEPKYTPMKQANRNLEAKQLNESRHIAKRGVSPGINPGVRQMQAKSDVEEARKRIAAKKK